MLERAGALALLGALALPFTTWMRWHYPDINESMRAVPLFIFTSLAITLGGLFLSNWDKPLGFFCSYCGISTLFTQTSLSLAMAHWIIVASALYIVLVNLLSIEIYRKLAVVGLLISATIQSIVALLQLSEFSFVTYAQKGFVHGTLTHHTFLGVFLAMIIPLASMLALPILLVGLLTSASLTGFVAAFIGLVSQVKNRRFQIALSVLALLLTCYTFWNKSHDSLYSRLRLWIGAFRDFDTSWRFLLFGKGLGSWFTAGYLDIKDPEQVFYQAHNEYLQLLYEMGILGVFFLAWWIYANRATFKSGAVIALAVCCFSTYVFHLVFLSVTAIIILAICKNQKVKAQERKEIKCDDILSPALSSSAYYL